MHNDKWLFTGYVWKEFWHWNHIGGKEKRKKKKDKEQKKKEKEQKKKIKNKRKRIKEKE